MNCSTEIHRVVLMEPWVLKSDHTTRVLYFLVGVDEIESIMFSISFDFKIMNYLRKQSKSLIDIT